MTRTHWIALLVVAALAGGLWYANEQGHLDAARSSYADWAGEQASAKAAREAEGRKPTLLEMAKDSIVWLAPGR